ncbi:MAG: hypothetical protein ACOZJZ_22545 [Pseudomonadota bacterium]
MSEPQDLMASVDDRGRAWRVAVVLCALLAALNLAAGLTGGLARLGWDMGRGSPLSLHGLLLVCGFFGTLLGLERALALRQAWGLGVPFAASMGGLLAWSGAPVEQALLLWLLASVGLLALYVRAATRGQRTLPVSVEMLGAACWFAGMLLWLQGNLAHEAMAAWMAFLVLTLAGEEREWAQRGTLAPAARGLFKAAVLLLPAAVLLALLEGLSEWPRRLGWQDASQRTWWIGSLLLGLWLLWHDPARHHWRAPAWRGFGAQALTLGYGWLVAGGVLGLAGAWWPMAAAGPAWHAVLLGFAFSVLFARVPALLPAMVRIEPRYSALLYLPLWGLAAGMALRIGAMGFRHPVLLAASGVLAATAIGLYVLLMARAAWAGRR